MAKTKPAKIIQSNPAASKPEPDQAGGGIAAEDLEVLSGDIDARMKALLADHKRMGARK